MTEEQGQQRVIAGRYTVIRELGRGGMGVVWLAEDKTIGRQVAIKELLLPAGIAPAERHVFEERVLREARTAGRLSDPGIVTVHDVVQEEGATFIVMELIEAPNLSDVIGKQGAMPTEQVLKVAEQLLSALQTAHTAGVVHRDVKPSNVIVAPNGRVKLADFGIAQSTEDSRLTSTGMLVGSPTYISPERLLGQDASPASDLWALGATLFFAAEGYGAYERSTTAASIQAIMNERAQLRVAQGPLASLIMGLLDPSPETRLNAPQAHYLIEQARGQRPPTGPQPVLAAPFQQSPSTGPQTIQHQPVSNGTHVLPAPRKGRRAIGIAAAAVVLIAAVATILALTGVFSGSTTGGGSGSAAPGSAGSGAKDQGGPGTASTSSDEAGSPGSSDNGGPGGSTDVAQSRPKSMQQVKTYGPGGDITTEDLVLYGTSGTCFNGAAMKEVVDDCAKPHDTEVFGNSDLDEASSYPEMAKLAEAAEEGCIEEYSGLSVKDKDTVLKFWALVPTKTVWENGRRRVLCVVAKADGGKLTGSVEDN